ncbi:hypothetical protein BD779DRAFT_152722 [Infundibulicybe gibba]|nr:hypothetical protein BD779DRAFT_152722 [Infundibulicybe gibba]
MLHGSMCQIPYNGRRWPSQSAHARLLMIMIVIQKQDSDRASAYNVNPTSQAFLLNDQGSHLNEKMLGETLFLVVLSVDESNQTLVLHHWRQHWSRNLKLFRHSSTLILRDESPETSAETKFKLTLMISASDVPNQSDKFESLTTQLFKPENLSEEDDILPQTLVEWHMYKNLEPGTEDLTTSYTHIFVMVSMTPQPGAEQNFNDWYTEEHIPLLSRVPGWVSSHRFLLWGSSASAPQYLALHQWESTVSFKADEYKLATGTPWRTNVMEQIVEKERHVLICTGYLDDVSP